MRANHRLSGQGSTRLPTQMRPWNLVWTRKMIVCRYAMEHSLTIQTREPCLVRPTIRHSRHCMHIDCVPVRTRVDLASLWLLRVLLFSFYFCSSTIIYSSNTTRLSPNPSSSTFIWDKIFIMFWVEGDPVISENGIVLEVHGDPQALRRHRYDSRRGGHCYNPSSQSEKAFRECVGILLQRSQLASPKDVFFMVIHCSTFLLGLWWGDLCTTSPITVEPIEESKQRHKMRLLPWRKRI